MQMNIPVEFKTWLSLKEAAKRMNLKYSQYVRRLVKEKKLRAVKLDFGFRTKWLVDPASCDAYVNRTSRGFPVGPISRRILRFNNTLITDDDVTTALTTALGPSSLEDGILHWSCEKPVQRKPRPKVKPEAPVDWTVKILEMYSPGDSSDEAEAGVVDDALA